MRKISILFLVVILILSSCVSRKKTMYFKNTKTDSTEVFTNVDSAYKLQIGDILYIRVLSLNKEISDVFNVASVSTNSYGLYNNESSLYINGFTINDSGKVVLPILGEINLAGKTVSDARREVQKTLGEYIKDGIADLKLISYRYTILGEVRKPGVFVNYSDKLNIFEALGNAGDVNEYGDRTTVTIIRPTKTGTESVRFDLSGKEILTSKYFYIKPNDIVYVEPLRYKIWHINTTNIALLLTSVTTLVVVLNYLK